MTEAPRPDAVTAAAAEAAAAAIHAEELLRVATALLEARSENPGGTEDEAASVASAFLGGVGADPAIVRGDAGRPTVVASIGREAGPSLAWNGHLDTVPAGSLETWSHPPFAGTIDRGMLVGRGAADMKGAVAAALAAAAGISRAGIDLGGSLVFHLAADEEMAGIHGTKVLMDGGYLDQDAAVVGEPSSMRIGLAQRGGCWLTLTAYGKAAHGSTPELGVNAITAMSLLIPRLAEALPDVEHPLVGRPSVNPALIRGGSAPNVVPDRCEVDVDRRIIPGETDPEEVRAPFVGLIESLRAEHPQVQIDVQIREWTDAAEAPPDSRIAQIARAAVAVETGRPAKDTGFTGITDARYYINEARIPTVILGPGSLRVAHTADEAVALEELVTAARTYARLFVTFLGT